MANKLLIFEGIDKAGKTSMIGKLLKLGLVDYYVKFSEPAAHSGIDALLKEYQFHIAIVKGMQQLRQTNRFQIFDRFIPSEIAYSTALRNEDYKQPSHYSQIELGLRMLKQVDHSIIYLDIDYDTYCKRLGDELTEDQFHKVKSGYSIQAEGELQINGLEMIKIDNRDYDEGWLTFKRELVNEM